MLLIYRTIWPRLFFLLSLFVSFHAWACSTGGCTKMSDQSIPSSSFSSSSSAATDTSYTFSDSAPGTAVPVASSAPPKLAAAVKYNPDKPPVDFGKLVRGDASWRGVMKDKGGSPAARQEHQAVMGGNLNRVASDGVVWPGAYQKARAAAGASRVRTIATGGGE